MTARRLVLGGILAAFGVLGTASLSGACGGPPPPATSPVIIATPTSVEMGDDYRTPITLDGTMSTATLTLVPVAAEAGAPLLTYLWTLSGSAYRIVSGTLTSDKLTVTMAGDQPLQVDLEVENSVGGSADTTATISVTLPFDAGPEAAEEAGADAGESTDGGPG